jgi:hypothetical protein
VSNLLTGLLFGGVKKELFGKLLGRGLKLVTKVKEDTLMLLNEKIMLRKRSVVFRISENGLELEHTQPINFLVHILSIIAS